MAVSDGQTITVVKDMGLVTSVFTPHSLDSLQGHLGLGHVRYSTMGQSNWRNAQPVYRSHGDAGFALGHNGNLTNVAMLESEAGMLPGFTPSDSDLIGELLARAFPIADEGSVAEGLEEALCSVLPRLEGAFSLGLIDTTRLYAVRDPNGFRPLCLGRLEWPDEEGWAVASESPALATVGASFVREIEPGELVVIGQDGVRSLRPFPPARVVPKLCVFEFVYFARPDAELYGREVHAARRRMGERLADESPVEADLVIGVPDSGVPAAEGFSVRSGIPFGQGLVKNRYIGRTFIAPTVAARSDGVRRKLNPLRESVGGKRLVVIDDSIVRGTTTSQIVRVLREAGARRDPPQDLVAAVSLALFLRDRHPRAGGAARRLFGPRGESPPNSVRIPSRTCRWKGCFRPSASRGPSSVRLVFPASIRRGFPCPRRTLPASCGPRGTSVPPGGSDAWSPATRGEIVVVGTGVDPVTSRFSGARSAN